MDRWVKPGDDAQVRGTVLAMHVHPSHSADARSEKVRGRAGRRGSDGPTGFDVSRHRSGTAISAEAAVRYW
jgi:hypothetical protein